MPIICHLIRHGEVENPQGLVYADLPGFSLSQLGVRQAQAAAHHLADRPLAAIYSSPLRRAQQTATLIAQPHPLSPVVLPDLTEWKLLNQWKGQPWEKLAATHPDAFRAYLTRPWEIRTSPESLADLADRVTQTITTVANDHAGAEIAIVSHQATIQAALRALTRKPWTNFWDDPPEHAEIVTLQHQTDWQLLHRIVPQ